MEPARTFQWNLPGLFNGTCQDFSMEPAKTGGKQRNRMSHTTLQRPAPNMAGAAPDQQIPVLWSASRARAWQHDLKLWLSLLLILCAGSVGALSLVAPSPTAATTRPHPRPRAPQAHVTAPPIATSTPATPAFAQGQCTAMPLQMNYLDTDPQMPPQLPGDWLAAGRTARDFPIAQACAAAFITSYQSFNGANPKTFAACVSMLSAGAKERFYGYVPSIKADLHTDPAWRKRMQQQHIVQVARADHPVLIDARYTRGRLLVWMAVTVHIATTIKLRTTTSTATYTLLLLAVPIDPNAPGTGWQVSSWQPGAGFFPPFEPL